MRVLMVLAALAVAACSPAASPPASDPSPAATPAPAPAEPAAPAPTASADQASCVARGGEWRPICRMQQPACVTKFADAGKACKDGDDCSGDCMAPSVGGGFAQEGSSVVGACAINDDPCGCRQTVENGVATAAICID